MSRRGRRTVILAEGSLGVLESKTACCVIRYRPEDVVAVLDSRNAGRDCAEVLGTGAGIPILASIEETAGLDAEELLIGIAPRGGALPDAWRPVLRRAIEMRLDIVSGLHTFLGEDAELAPLAAARGTRIRDLRRPPAAIPVGMGRARGADAAVILTVGTDCDVGKMTVSREIYRAARAEGIATAFVATGQTGIYLDGAGVVIDGVKADFVSGAVESMVLDAAARSDLVIVEGQGSLIHPGYSAVTLGLIHGTLPDGFVLCHLPGRREIADTGIEIPGLAEWIEIYEGSVKYIKEAPVLGIALNTFDLDPGATRAAIEAAHAATGLPVADPIKFGVDALMDPIRKVVKRG